VGSVVTRASAVSPDGTRNPGMGPIRKTCGLGAFLERASKTIRSPRMIGINWAGFIIPALCNEVSMLAWLSHRRVCLGTGGIGNSIVLPIYVPRSVQFEKQAMRMRNCLVVLNLVSFPPKGPGNGSAVAYDGGDGGSRPPENIRAGAQDGSNRNAGYIAGGGLIKYPKLHWARLFAFAALLVFGAVTLAWCWFLAWLIWHVILGTGARAQARTTSCSRCLRRTQRAKIPSRDLQWRRPLTHASRWVDRRLAAILPQPSSGDARQAFRQKNGRESIAG
jgi:hypothetical protein